MKEYDEQQDSSSSSSRASSRASSSKPKEEKRKEDSSTWSLKVSPWYNVPSAPSNVTTQLRKRRKK